MLSKTSEILSREPADVIEAPFPGERGYLEMTITTHKIIMDMIEPQVSQVVHRLVVSEFPKSVLHGSDARAACCRNIGQSDGLR